jgi:aerobic carbon-monoxide dehydrogenase medium subunit
VKPPPFDYHVPASVDEACTLLAALDNAKVLAGGQSLMAMLNLRFLYPDHVIDINRVPGLDGIDVDEQRLSFGAMVRQRRAETDPAVVRAAPIFREALAVVGHRQTRNRGTIGGSLCHLDPAAELPLLALVHDAVVHVVASAGRRRTIPVAGFIGGFMSPAIEPDELVAAVEFPRWPVGHGYAFVERARRHGDFALAAVACLLTVDGSGRVARIALGVAGVGPIAVRLTNAEIDLLGTSADAPAIARAAQRCAELEALSDFHGSAGYRRSVATALVRKTVAIAYERARNPRGGAA